MIITCPSCSARYVVDPVKIGSDGRTVKCAKCGHAWAQPAPTPEKLENAAGVSSAPAPAPTPDKIGEALRDRVGREAREPDADEFDEDTGDDFRSNFDDAFGREPEPPGRPLRSTSSSNLPAPYRERLAGAPGLDRADCCDRRRLRRRRDVPGHHCQNLAAIAKTIRPCRADGRTDSEKSGGQKR